MTDVPSTCPHCDGPLTPIDDSQTPGVWIVRCSTCAPSKQSLEQDIVSLMARVALLEEEVARVRQPYLPPVPYSQYGPYRPPPRRVGGRE